MTAKSNKRLKINESDVEEVNRFSCLDCVATNIGAPEENVKLWG
jgi:hypothetical protein